jgi:2-dehydro-3-deoxyphosphooctonate aldolase (KDO 8-P synthase)
MPGPSLNFADAPLFIVAGPCVIESEELCLRVGTLLRDTCRRLGLGFVFKASFDKANRSSVAGYRGPGIEAGVAILDRVRQTLGVPVLTDVHEADQAAVAAKVIDVLQVPAFLARQTDLLAACGATDRVVNIKKGQFMSPQEMRLAVEKVRSARAASRSGMSAGAKAKSSDATIWLTERGTFFGYNRLVNDFTALPIMQSLGCPVVFDITHSTQQPAGLGDKSGGNPSLSPMLARAAVAAGVDGLFLECHPDPASAKSDAAAMLPLDIVPKLLEECRQLADLRQGWRK